MKKIIGLAAKARSGKDTAAAILLAHPGVAAFALADPLKAGCKGLFGLTDSQAWDDTAKEMRLDAWGCSPREFFQRVGTEWFREHDPLHWLKRADREINSPLAPLRQLTPAQRDDPETPFVLATQSFFGLNDEQVWNTDARDQLDEFWSLTPRMMIDLVRCMTDRDFPTFELQRKAHAAQTKEVANDNFESPQLNLAGKEIVIIKDIRFENEAEYIRDRGGDIWHIVRDNTEKVKNHSSEAGIKFITGDILIENNGTIEEYTNAVSSAFSNLKEKLAAR